MSEPPAVVATEYTKALRDVTKRFHGVIRIIEAIVNQIRHDTLLNIKTQFNIFEIKLNPYRWRCNPNKALGFITDENNGFNAKPKKTKIKEWINASIGRKWADTVFFELFLSLEQDAKYVALAVEPDDAECYELLFSYLKAAYFEAAILASSSGGTKSGHRPLICDQSYRKTSKMWKELVKHMRNEPMVRALDNAGHSNRKEFVMSYYRKDSQRYLMAYTTAKSRRNGNPNPTNPALTDLVASANNNQIAALQKESIFWRRRCEKLDAERNDLLKELCSKQESNDMIPLLKYDNARQRQLNSLNERLIADNAQQRQLNTQLNQEIVEKCQINDGLNEEIVRQRQLNNRPTQTQINERFTEEMTRQRQLNTGLNEEMARQRQLNTGLTEEIEQHRQLSNRLSEEITQQRQRNQDLSARVTLLEEMNTVLLASSQPALPPFEPSQPGLPSLQPNLPPFDIGMDNIMNNAFGQSYPDFTAASMGTAAAAAQPQSVNNPNTVVPESPRAMSLDGNEMPNFNDGLDEELLVTAWDMYAYAPRSQSSSNDNHYL